ncbi:MAG: HTTM domain-containing protein [Acidobacteriota bacterium]
MEVFSIDLRVLALYRIAAGLVTIVDLLLRWPAMSLWLGPDTFHPAELARADLPICLSVHALNDSWWMQVVLYLLALGAAISLTVGYRSRWSAALSWYLLTSLLLRNPHLVDAGDSFFAVSLVWLMFLPCGETWSVDSRRNGTSGTTAVCSLASAGLLLQPALAFFFSGIAKMHGSTWPGGTAIRVAVGDDAWAQPFGLWLVESPTRVAMATHATLVLEMAGPLLLLLAPRRELVRPVVLLALFGLTAGMGLSIQLQLIPLKVAITLIPFLPGWILDRLSKTEFRVRGLGEPEHHWLRRWVPAYLLVTLVLLNVQGVSRFGSPTG